MEPSFRSVLAGRKIKEPVLVQLEAEDITSEEIFRSLRRDDLRLLFDRGLTVGQYSLICRVWEEMTMTAAKSETKGI